MVLLTLLIVGLISICFGPSIYVMIRYRGFEAGLLGISLVVFCISGFFTAIAYAIASTTGASWTAGVFLVFFALFGLGALASEGLQKIKSDTIRGRLGTSGCVTWFLLLLYLAFSL